MGKQLLVSVWEVTTKMFLLAFKKLLLNIITCILVGQYDPYTLATSLISSLPHAPACQWPFPQEIGAGWKTPFGWWASPPSPTCNSPLFSFLFDRGKRTQSEFWCLLRGRGVWNSFGMTIFFSSPSPTEAGMNEFDHISSRVFCRTKPSHAIFNKA